MAKKYAVPNKKLYITFYVEDSVQYFVFHNSHKEASDYARDNATMDKPIFIFESIEVWT